jgi:hypothetical protein
MCPALAAGYIDIYPMVGRSAKDRNIDMYLIYICLPTVKTKAASGIEPKAFR